MDHRRKRAKESSALDGAGAPAEHVAASDSAQRSELARLVRQAVNSLPERQRRALILHRYEGLTHADIAEVTGWSQSAVESLLVRAYGLLRQKLKKYQDSGD